MEAPREIGVIQKFLSKFARTITATLCVFCAITAVWLIHSSKQSPITLTQQATLPQPEHHEDPIHWATITIKNGDNLSTIFKRHEIPQKTLVQLRQNHTFKQYTHHLNIGQHIHIGRDDQNTLIAMRIPLGVDKDMTVKLDPQQTYQVNIHHTDMERQYTSATITINNSLDLAAQRLHLDSRIPHQLATIYGDEVNMKRDLRKGDQFKVLYEQYLIGNKVVKTGDVIAAQYLHKNQSLDAVRYTLPNHSASYYDLSGKNLEKSFIRYPVQYKRVSSPFNLTRMHPILKIRRPHYGVDLAAKYGTPVHVVADGTVSTVGFLGGYGRTVKVQHGHGRMTIYAHLSRYTKGLKKGQKVSKNQVIAYVGSSGYATGPHLHLEIRIHNKPVNPLTIALPSAQPLSETEMAQYVPIATHWLNMLDAQQPSDNHNSTLQS